MTEDLLYLAIFLMGMAVGGALVALLREDRWLKRHIADEAPEETVLPALTQEQVDEVIVKSQTPFDVTGKPRAVPWHIRKKQLEAAHRTKRRRLESFREVD